MRTALRISLLIILGIIVLLVILRLALGPLALHFLNQQLEDMGGFRGHVETLDLGLLAGEAELGSVRIESKVERIEVPVFTAEAVGMSVDWSAIWNRGRVVGELVLDQPVVNYIGDVDLVPPQPKEPKKPEEPGWRTKLERMTPVTIDRIRIVDGQFSYRLYGTDPPVHFYVRGVDGFVRNLTNEPGKHGRFAEFRADGTVLEQGDANATGSIDPLSELDFDLHLRVMGMKLTSLNPMTEAFAGFDFRGGTGDLIVDLGVTDGQVDGFIKPLLYDVNIFTYEQDVAPADEGLLSGIWEGMLGLGAEVAENQPQDQFATEIQLSGNIYEDTEVSPVQALIAILENGFVDAFTPTFQQESGE